MYVIFVRNSLLVESIFGCLFCVSYKYYSNNHISGYPLRITVTNP